jgi:hypothetical protein
MLRPSPTATAFRRGAERPVVRCPVVRRYEKTFTYATSSVAGPAGHVE